MVRGMVWDFHTIPHTKPSYHTIFYSMPNTSVLVQTACVFIIYLLIFMIGTLEERVINLINCGRDAEKWNSS